MSQTSSPYCVDTIKEYKTMNQFGETFIHALPEYMDNLTIPGRAMFSGYRRQPITACTTQTNELQAVIGQVLHDPTTAIAQLHAERAFQTFLNKDRTDSSVMRFFNGWNETHKTTSLVSIKIIMRLSADAISVPAKKQSEYLRVMAHMHEVAKDDFGLGHPGHDGMYHHMAAAFDAIGWAESQYSIKECIEFSKFLYNTGIANHQSALESDEYENSIMDAMMTSIASELWNGREFNFIAQYIERKLISANPSLRTNAQGFRDAKGYVMGHSGEVENRHGLHAIAAAQAYARTSNVPFEPRRLKEVMLDYNWRVGKAFEAIHRALRSPSDQS